MFAGSINFYDGYSCVSGASEVEGSPCICSLVASYPPPIRVLISIFELHIIVLILLETSAYSLESHTFLGQPRGAILLKTCDHRRDECQLFLL